MKPREGIVSMMNTLRACAIAVCCTVPALTSAQAAYPNKPVTLIVPFAAGGFTDTVGRLIAQGLTERWKSPVVVENRAGAGGNLAAAHAAKQPADGYTLFLANTATNVINPNIYKHMGVSPDKDFEPVILVVKTPNVLAVNNDLPVKSVKELVELAKKEPGKLNFGTPGNGTTGHFTGTLFNNVAGIKLVHVPYKGTPQVLNDLMGGTVQLTFDNVTSWAPHAKSGKVRALAVTSEKRSPLLPDVPTLQELGYQGFESTTFAGIAVPSGTPPEIVARLNADIGAVIDSAEFRTRMNGGQVVGGTPESFKRYIADEAGKWGKVAREIGLTVE
ncbi:MAG: tripartite tricarboxylate transporter substrate binding protein [Burkholderiales bacterium]|nr:tripartite tricarboxylate transporter substrate binding protein [Burkholderiales bacterium]